MDGMFEYGGLRADPARERNDDHGSGTESEDRRVHRGKQEQLLRDIAALVAIDSVEAPGEGAPFGKGPRAPRHWTRRWSG